ncbi:Protein transport protein Sec61 subunit gamma-1 [Hibiscus syriacus]|uniref:Protein transport protein Sec61 subunit gamma-1 n=1 Tax=Hibiscus syriacus TaxID=106335 RepID=A0A6A2XB24_HIBSY|nr:Protein transport protein Sec61 subunit gamma-1 [Hibiscus syriacus]
MDALYNVVDPLRDFAKDNVRLVKRCHKLNRKVGGDISSAQAVLLGALAPGVNAPTWNTLKSTFLMLGICLVVMLGLVFSSSGSSLIPHVSFLVLIVVPLFLLLNCITSENVIEHKTNHIGDTPIISSSSLPSPYVCSSRTQLGSDQMACLLHWHCCCYWIRLIGFFRGRNCYSTCGLSCYYSASKQEAPICRGSLVGQSPDLVVFLSLVEKCWQDLCEAVDRTLLNHLLKMFTILGIYSESFEKPFLECTSEFYAAERMKYMLQSDVPDYLKHVDVPLHISLSQLAVIVTLYFELYMFYPSK